MGRLVAQAFCSWPDSKRLLSENMIATGHCLSYNSSMVVASSFSLQLNCSFVRFLNQICYCSFSWSQEALYHSNSFRKFFYCPFCGIVASLLQRNFTELIILCPYPPPPFAATSSDVTNFHLLLGLHTSFCSVSECLLHHPALLHSVFFNIWIRWSHVCDHGDERSIWRRCQ